MNPPVDFFARRRHFIDHLLPVWNALRAEARGCFYVPACLAQYAESQGLQATVLQPKTPDKPLHVLPDGSGPIVLSAYGDLVKAYYAHPRRKLILMEHGVGITFNHPGYAGGLGMRRKVSLFLAPNEYIAAKTCRTIRDAKQVVIGTPKLDGWAAPSVTQNDHPVVAIAFHWDGHRVAPEAGNAFRHYREILPALRDRYQLLGHAHPKILDELAPIYESLGIEVVRDFRDVMERADVYVNDCSSTAYEFLVTGKPVVLLNAPWFRRHVRWGLRFWDYSNIGPQVNQRGELIPAIDALLADPTAYRAERQKAIADLYPNLGRAAQVAARAIEECAGWKRR